jgi:RNA polymerase sigma-70 factor (ECF subfamily)
LLIERFEKSLLSYAYRLTGDQQGAQDIVQVVFLKFYQKFWDMQPIEHLSALLYKMTGNLSKNFIRDKSRKKEISLNLDSSSTSGFSIPVISDAEGHSTTELETIIRKAIDRLPSRQKTALILKIYENKSYEQIAEILDTSKNNVMVLIHRAHNALIADKTLKIYLDINKK